MTTRRCAVRDRLATRIVAVVEALRNHPYLGRAGAEPGIRELIIGGTPYSILYRIRGKRVIRDYDKGHQRLHHCVHKGTIPGGFFGRTSSHFCD